LFYTIVLYIFFYTIVMYNCYIQVFYTVDLYNCSVRLFYTNVIKGVQSITKYRKKEFKTDLASSLVEKLNELNRLPSSQLSPMSMPMPMTIGSMHDQQY
jgi:hypothetical protein